LKDEDRFLGIDVDAQLVNTARAKIKNHQAQIQFQCCDIVNGDDQVIEQFLRENNRAKFDVIFCFSVSMWIHLNHGEEGLNRLFTTVKKYCDNMFIFEPQPWKCYMTAARRMRKLRQPKFDHLDRIEHRQEQLVPHVTLLCETAGFTPIHQLGQTNWNRPIILYSVKKNIQE